MAGARALWAANGMKREQLGRPIVAVVNSFTQFVPGHTHLHDVGQLVKQEIERMGCFAAEFNTIAIDDGIAMGHDGMLYSLPSRDLIADSVEYMVQAHKADAMICISNCDKITPGMLMAAMRLNIPAVFVSGGPMEAGRHGERSLDLIDAMVLSADASADDAEVEAVERNACPTCGSCSGMFTANSMNCLNEALGLALPGNGTVVATNVNRRKLFSEAARLIVENAYRYYRDNDASVLPRSIATRAAFLNAMRLDIAMGGSTNTVLHLLAIAHEAEVDFTMDDIDALSRQTPCLCKVAPNSAKYHIEDVNRAGGVMAILGELSRAGVLDTSVRRVDGLTLAEAIDRYDIRSPHVTDAAKAVYHSAPGLRFNLKMGSQRTIYDKLDTDRAEGCIRDVTHAYSKDGGLAILKGNIALRGQDGGRRRTHSALQWAGTRFPIARRRLRGYPRRTSQRRRCGRHHARGAEGWPRHAGNALSHVVHQIHAPRRRMRAHHRRTLQWRHIGAEHRTHLAGSSLRRRHRACPHGRHHRHRHPRAHHQRASQRGRTGRAPEGGGGTWRGGLAATPRPYRIEGSTRLRQHGFISRRGGRANHLTFPPTTTF